MNASSREIAVISVVLALASAASFSARGAELRPYTLPSQQAEPRIEQRGTGMRPQIDDRYYRDFEQEARDLNPEQRARLVQSFEKQRDQAIKVGDMDAAQHYLRLLQILQKGR